MIEIRFFHTPAGTAGPLERGLIKATNSGENFEGWVVGFYGEWSDTLAKLLVPNIRPLVLPVFGKIGRLIQV